MALLQMGVNIDLPTVQLLHTLPDGSHHADWMIARDDSPTAMLVTFRLTQRLEELGEGHETPAEQIGDHRRAYLTYEGPVSGGRGAVTRLSAGRVTTCAGDDRGLLLHLQWGESEQHLCLSRQKSGLWLVKNVSLPAFFGNNEDRTR